MQYFPESSDELFKRNEEYMLGHKPMYHYSAENFVSTKRMVVVSCIDQRAVPEQFCGLSVGEIPVFRCVGGRAKYAINDIAVLQSLITLTEIVLVHHKDCGLTHKTDEQMRAKIEAISQTEADKLDFNGLAITDFHKSIEDDLAWLRAHPLISKDTVLTGCFYDIDTGKLEKVQNA